MKITLPTTQLFITVITVSVHSFFSLYICSLDSILDLCSSTQLHSLIHHQLFEHEVRHTSTTKTARITKTVETVVALVVILSGNRGQHGGQHSGLTTDVMGFISHAAVEQIAALSHLHQCCHDQSKTLFMIRSNTLSRFQTQNRIFEGILHLEY